MPSQDLHVDRTIDVGIECWTSTVAVWRQRRKVMEPAVESRTAARFQIC